MPSGYTCGVQEGKITDVKDFILTCSRGFGAFIHMRDDNLNTEIKYQEVGEYYPRRLEQAKREFEEFKQLSDEDIQKQLDERYEAKVKENRESLKRFDEQRQRYLDMIEKVKEWNPPTEDHIKLKEFALDQLNSSLDFDCNESMRNCYLEEPIKDNLNEYKQGKIKRYLKDIEYYSKYYREEIEEVEKANKWIDDLVNSFE